MTTTELTSDVAQSIVSTLERIVEPSQRIYWPFLLTSAAIAIVVLLIKRESLRNLFSSKLWMHSSARMDYRLLFVNAVVKAVLWGSIVLSALAVVVFVDTSLRHIFGQFDALQWASWKIISLYTIVLFVGLDASRYALHRLMHKIPFLWHFHQVHHSAEVLTPLTVYRVHPVESLLAGFRAALATGLITGVFWYLFRGQASQAEFLGVNAIGITLNALGANLRHSHVWLSYGRLESLLISPAQHQMHHSVDVKLSMSNYGAFLSVWDRLGGTLRHASSETRPKAFGLLSSDCNHDPDSVLSAYFGPLSACGQDLATYARRLSVRPATSALALSALQCSSSSPPDKAPDAQSDGFDRKALVENLGQNVILGAYEKSLVSTQAMSPAIDAYCQAIGNADESEKRGLAQDGWKLAMTSWQESELMAIGPAGPDSLALRDFIYSWPITSACAVDQDVMLAYTDTSYDITQAQLNSRGLDSLEYLLFNTILDSTCPIQVAPPGWNALSELEKWQARCAYSQLAVLDLEAQQANLISAWNGVGGYLENLTSAGSASSDFASVQEAINEIFFGIFYFELVTKDIKAGGALGIATNSCAVVDELCLEMLESGYANISKENILGNLTAFENMVSGQGGLGFADFLIGVDASATADALILAIDAAQTAYEGLDGTLENALINDYSGARTAYEALQGVTDILKVQMPGILNLDIPQAADGDVD